MKDIQLQKSFQICIRRGDIPRQKLCRPFKEGLVSAIVYNCSPITLHAALIIVKVFQKMVVTLLTKPT